MKRSAAALVILAVALVVPAANARLSEKELERCRSAVLSRVIDDNPGREEDIRTFFNGMVMERNMGIRLLDKFGIFMSNMEKKDIDIQRTRFFRQDSLYSLFFVMKDRKDGQLYTLFLEYEYGRKARCVLKDIYFSIVFEERMGEIKSFFEAR